MVKVETAEQVVGAPSKDLGSLRWDQTCQTLILHCFNIVRHKIVAAAGSIHVKAHTVMQMLLIPDLGIAKLDTAI